MDIQRANSKSIRRSLYEGAGVLGLEMYFAGRSKLGTSLLRYEFAPGASEGMHLHSADVESSCTPDSSDELYLVIRGELVMTIGAERTTLSVGDAAYAPAGVLHGIINETQLPAELIVVFGAPIRDAPTK